MNNSTILVGDCRDLLQTLDTASVQTCVTSPPYFGLRDYGVDGQIGLEQTPAEYVAKLVQVFREVRRVLRDDGTLWLNLGDSYAAQRGGTHMPAQTVSGGEGGKGDEVAFRGMGGEQRGCAHRNASKIGLKHKDLIGIPWRVAFALQDDGWYLRQDIVWHKPNPMPESVRDRCTKAHEYLFLLTKSPRYYFDADAIKEASATNDPRRPYTSKGAKELDGRREWKSGQNRDGGDFTKRNKRSVWTVSPKPFRGAHFATFPPDLIEPCILAGSRPGDLVLDPFLGAGTTALVAERLGRRWIGCELNPEYANIARRRLEGEVAPQASDMRAALQAALAARDAQGNGHE